MSNRLLWLLVVMAVFLPRLLRPDTFFIQDEQPWLDRSQLYINSLLEGDLNGAARYPLSNHPAIPLMTVIGPAMNWYMQVHDLQDTYGNWPLNHKREAATLGRWVWGIACSGVLLALFATAKQLAVFRNRPQYAAVLVILFGLEPWIWGITRAVSVDVMMGLGLVGAFLTSAWVREQGKWWQFCLAGAWWALAFISKSPALITIPFLSIFTVLVWPLDWRLMLQRAGLWLLGIYVGMVVMWPPFLIHPITRILDVLARAELHAEAQEAYFWPGMHPPFFIFTLSTIAFVGCAAYVALRLYRARATEHRSYIVFDVMLFAAIFHGIVLIYLQGDHARKNLPVLALTAVVGAVGWLRLFERFRLKINWVGPLLILLQLGLVGWYFPHVITAHNLLFASEGAKRLLVDVGNGSRLAADYINSLPPETEVALPMDSLIQPYVTRDRRDLLHELPEDGKLSNLDGGVKYLFVPASFPARVTFDANAKTLLDETASHQPQDILSIRNVPIFYVYRLK